MCHLSTEFHENWLNNYLRYLANKQTHADENITPLAEVIDEMLRVCYKLRSRMFMSALLAGLSL